MTDHKSGGPIKYQEPKFPQFPDSIQYEPSPVIYESPEPAITHQKPEITYPGSSPIQYHEYSPVSYEPQKITYPGSPVKYELQEPEITYQSSGSGGIHQNFQQTFPHSTAGVGNDRNNKSK